MRRARRLLPFAIVVAAAVAFPAVAAANVQPGTYTAKIHPANAPRGTHFASGSSATCTVNNDLSIDCSSYTLAGVGHTNATVRLVASYTAVVDCTNKGGKLVLAQTKTATSSKTRTVTSSKNGKMIVPSVSVSPPTTTLNVCPNPNWTASIKSLTLNSFRYTLRFAGFSGPYIVIRATDP